MNTTLRDEAHKANLLGVFCKIALIMFGAVMFIVTVTTPIVGKFEVLGFLIIGEMMAATAISWALLRAGRLTPATWIFTGGLLLGLTALNYAFSTTLPLLVLLMLPYLISMTLQTMRQSFVLIGSGQILLAAMIVLEDVLKVYTPPNIANEQQIYIARLFILLVFFPVLLLMVYFPTRQREKLLAEQNEQLQTTLEALQERQVAGRKMSQEVLSLSAQLMSTAGQQASGSQEQASSLTQVTTSVVELSQAAGQIAEIAQDVSSSTAKMVVASTQIEQTAVETANRSQQGLQAVRRTTQVSQEVASLYSQLQGTLKELNRMSSNTRQFLSLIHSIAEETHLLSLNASIEAAGAGQYGERFAVIAQEVKDLANRSNKASQDVVGVVQEIEAAARDAVTTVENGYRKAVEMESVAVEAGQVIEAMRAVSEKAREEAGSIQLMAEQAREMSESIKVATGQQRSASHQVLEAVSGVSVVAKQSAMASAGLSDTARALEEMSSELTQRLTH